MKEIERLLRQIRNLWIVLVALACFWVLPEGVRYAILGLVWLPLTVLIVGGMAIYAFGRLAEHLIKLRMRNMPGHEEDA